MLGILSGCMVDDVAVESSLCHTVRMRLLVLGDWGKTLILSLAETLLGFEVNELSEYRLRVQQTRSEALY